MINTVREHPDASTIRRIAMNMDDAENLRFPTDEGEEITIDCFVTEQSANVRPQAQVKQT